jgi:hypothetical protein
MYLHENRTTFMSFFYLQESFDTVDKLTACRMRSCLLLSDRSRYVLCFCFFR